MYILKVKKFQECTCMGLYSVIQNIEGDANLHHSRGIGLATNFNEVFDKFLTTINSYHHQVE